MGAYYVPRTVTSCHLLLAILGIRSVRLPLQIQGKRLSKAEIPARAAQ